MPDPYPTEPRTLFESDHLRIGWLDLPADHPAWHGPCLSPSRPSVAFPTAPIVTDPAGMGERLIGPNHVIFANPRWPYRRRAVDPRGEQSLVLFPTDDHLEAAVERHDPGFFDGPRRAFRFGEGFSTPRIQLHARRFIHALRTVDRPEPDATLEAATLLIDLALDASWPTWRQRPSGRTPTTLAHRDAVRAACELLSARPAHPPSIDELGRHVHISPRHFCRIFRRHTGTTVHAYITRLRVRRVLDALPDAQGSLARLAHDSGFTDQAHMTRAFRAATALTPGAVARELAQHPSGRSGPGHAHAFANLLAEMRTDLQGTPPRRG